MVTETVVNRELPVAIATSSSKDHPSMPYMPYPAPVASYGADCGFGFGGGGLLGGLLLGAIFGNGFNRRDNDGGANLQATLGVATAEQTSTLLQNESASTGLLNASINRVGDGVLMTAAATQGAICESTKDMLAATRASQDVLAGMINCGNKEVTNQLWNLSTLTQKGFCDVQMQSALQTKDIQLQAENNTCKILGAVAASENSLSKQMNDIVLQAERDKIIVLQNKINQLENDQAIGNINTNINVNINQLNAIVANITAQLGTLTSAVSTLAARSNSASA